MLCYSIVSTILQDMRFEISRLSASSGQVVRVPKVWSRVAVIMYAASYIRCGQCVPQQWPSRNSDLEPAVHDTPPLRREQHIRDLIIVVKVQYLGVLRWETEALNSNTAD